MKKFAFLFVLCAVLAVAGSCLAAEYPSRAVTINTSRSGSQVDYIARAFAKTANKHFGANLIVNSTSGQIDAYRETMRATPDGYALGLVNNTVVINDVMGATDFNSITDVDMIAVVGTADGSWIAIRSELAKKGDIKTLDDLVAYSKKHPDELIITDRTASNTNTVVLQLEEAGLDVTPADAGTATDRLTNFLSGNCDIYVGAYGLIEQYIQKGDVVCLASCGEKRSQFSPDVPCTKELGYSVNSPVAYFVFAPKGMPEDIKATLVDLCRTTVADPDLAKDLANNTIEANFMDAEGATKFLADAKQDMIRLGMGEGYKE